MDCVGELIGLLRSCLFRDSTDRSRSLGLDSRDGCDMPHSELLSLLSLVDTSPTEVNNFLLGIYALCTMYSCFWHWLY